MNVYFDYLFFSQEESLIVKIFPKIPTKLLKVLVVSSQNIYIYDNIVQPRGNTLRTLKKRKSTPYIKKMAKKRKVIIGLLVLSQMFQKYIKHAQIKSITSLKIGFRNFNAVFARVTIYLQFNCISSQKQQKQKSTMEALENGLIYIQS